jgi:hypothetical protein
VRTVTYQYSLEPLSCAGSLTDIGGRFNAGCELDDNTVSPWPALYVAQDLETAFREKFGIASDDVVDGLTAHELALNGKVSHSNVILNGHLENPPRHNSCRLLRNQEHGGGDEGHQWHVTDNHSRTGQ